MSLDLLMDVEMPVVIRIGGARMLLREIAGLNTGSLVELLRAPDDPVELLVNGRLVARGNIAMVHGNYAIQITDVPVSDVRENG